MRSGSQISILIAVAALSLLSASAASRAFEAETNGAAGPKEFAGSGSCRECHQRFYELWSTSFHGLAMQPYSEVFAEDKLTPQKDALIIGTFRYQAAIGKGQGWIAENGPEGARNYRIEHVLGGKNVFYFLTLLEKGRLQTLPLAYDARRKEWIDMAQSGVRHLPDGMDPDEPLFWTERPYTFNTACYGCHVSQLSTNYNPDSDTYHTVWAEPGINCETCHGPSSEHNAVARATPRGQPLADAKIISTKTMTKEQRNHLCASCHAKTTTPLTPFCPPGAGFFDHFDLVTLESPDYYPDGRDLGENYTYTSWLMSPCVKSGKLDCMHCHTSSGRYRFKTAEDANKACLPCHEERVSNAPDHTHHAEGSAGNKCVSCHMPTTAFARMNRSDHSMLPPAPAATMVYKSPNACNLCHSDKDPAWADNLVREWRPRDYQAPVLHRAELVDATRRRDWSKREAMLQYITSPNRDEVFAASLLRLIPPSLDSRVSLTLRKAAGDPSPLIRAAAMEPLAMFPSEQNLQALMAATGDEVRLVRIRAAAALSAFADLGVGSGHEEAIRKADEEYLASLRVRPDQWSSQYNLGNYHLSRGELKEAVASYDQALKLEPRAVMAMVNASIAFAQMGLAGKAEESLERALETSPENAAALFNMGLLRAEQNERREAEALLRAALKSDPQMAQAAYNLCVLLSGERPGEAVGFCREASRLRPDDPKYGYTLALLLHKTGQTAEAITRLKETVEQYPSYQDAIMLLQKIYPRAQYPQ